MKNIFLTIAIVAILTFSTCDQDRKNVPDDVKTAFSQKFQDAAKVKWDNEEENEWEAEFRMNGKKMCATFNNKGVWLETETEIKKKDIPEAVLIALNSEFGKYTIEEVEFVENPDYKGYEINLEKEEADISIVADMNGNILKKDIRNEEDEDGEQMECNEMMKESRQAGEMLYTDEFETESYTFSTTGRNRYLILETGYQLILEGKDEDNSVRLEITVLNETRKIGDIETRILEEKEFENGQVIEISRNFLAFCNETSDIFYFGEETDIYKDGEVTDHEGSWRADEENCKAGLLMPGRVLLGARYYQEYALGVAMDRAENISVMETIQIPAGNFTGCLKTLETSAINPEEKEYKLYAPSIGLVRDEEMLLVKYGFKK